MELITMLNQMNIEDLKSMYYTLEKRCEMLEERCSKLENKLNAINLKTRKKTKISRRRHIKKEEK